MRRIASSGTILALLLLLRPDPVWAPFHLMVIEEVFFGTEDCPNAQYVKLRTLAFGQTLVTPQRMMTELADGTDAPDFGAFSSNPSNSAAGVAILMGTAEAQGLFGIEFDEVVSGSLPFADGRVCFANFLRAPVDCVAYGTFTGDNGSYGEPAATPLLGMALVRHSETSDNATDFSLGEPMPENNAGEIGVLGKCPPQSACTGDCDGNGGVTVDEIITGVNIALGSSSADACPAFDVDRSGTVTVDEIVSAVTNALSGCPA